ncbi:MAG TPA: heparan-alpha-glucosaminide N-acetyltransferase domain-containing protein [Candidatus Limnocylindrales bacterium]|nr:heparan-alpha-glucosaminide N-acetyltransferase domain-containing protein [Candidatus Limnocylindrales bacterium]
MATSAHTTVTRPDAALSGGGPAAGSRQRLESLDVFRGLTIAGMVLVNNPGTGSAFYWPLGHADELMSAHPAGWYPGKWWVQANGWTPTDLIFPFFLFIVGASMVMSFAARRARGDSRPALMKHVARRSALILLIGYAIRILPYVDFSRMRYPGVLQRIAVVYFCASLIALWTARRGRLLWIAGLLAGYYAVMRFLPVPGCDHAAWMTEHCSVAAWLDRKLMLGHLYRPDFDPEGLLSTFPAIATTLLGVLAGEFLRGPAGLAQKLRGLLMAGVAGMAAGYAWHPWFPISKPLWTGSYVLFTAGAACVTLALCWWLIEMRGWRLWSRPFLWLGSNAILAYALSTFVGKLGSVIKITSGKIASANAAGAGHAIEVQTWVYQHWFAPLAQPRNASLAFAISYLALWTLLAWGLYRKKIFVKV